MSDDLSGLNLVQLYDRLQMPVPPPPVSMWPQTAGWVWLGLILVIVIGLAAWKIAAWRRATAYRRAALVELQKVGDDPEAIAKILRRTALSGFPREQVAGLHGSGWLAFLDGTSDRVQFGGSKAGEVLAKASFLAQRPDKDLAKMAKTWIKTHKTRGAHV